MNMFLIRDVLLVKVIKLDLLLAMRCAQELEEVSLELVAVIVDVLLGVGTNEEHLADVRLGLGVHLEAVLVSGLLLANLAVPSQPLESFGLELVV